MKQLVKARANCKITITKLRMWIEKNGNIVTEINQLESRRDQLSSAFDKFTTLQDSIDELDNTQSQHDVKEELEGEFHEIMSIFKTI